MTRSSLRASLGAGALSHLHRHFAGMGNGFAGRSRLPSPATATRRRSKEGERAHPPPLGRFPTAPRPLTRPRSFTKKELIFPFLQGTIKKPTTGLRPYKPPFFYPNEKAVMTDGFRFHKVLKDFWERRRKRRPGAFSATCVAPTEPRSVSAFGNAPSLTFFGLLPSVGATWLHTLDAPFRLHAAARLGSRCYRRDCAAAFRLHSATRVFRRATAFYRPSLHYGRQKAKKSEHRRLTSPTPAARRQRMKREQVHPLPLSLNR